MPATVSAGVAAAAAAAVWSGLAWARTAVVARRSSWVARRPLWEAYAWAWRMGSAWRCTSSLGWPWCGGSAFLAMRSMKVRC